LEVLGLVDSRKMMATGGTILSPLILVALLYTKHPAGPVDTGCLSETERLLAA